MTDQLTLGTAALNRAALAYENHAADLRTEVDGAMGDLRGVVKNEMFFDATLDVTAPANDLANRVFTNLPDLIAATTPGAYVLVSCKDDQVIPVEANILLYGLNLRFVREAETGTPPKIRFRSYESNGTNKLYQFWCRGAVSVIFTEVDVEAEAKQNAGADWSYSERCCVRSRHGEGQFRVALTAATFFGAAETAIVQARFGCVVSVGLYSAKLSGACFAVNYAQYGITHLATATVTLEGGAQLRDGGTLGTNILEG